MRQKNANRDEVRQNTLTIPMTKSEKESVKNAADELGISMTTFARMVLKEKIANKERNV